MNQIELKTLRTVGMKGMLDLLESFDEGILIEKEELDKLKLMLADTIDYLDSLEYAIDQRGAEDVYEDLPCSLGFDIKDMKLALGVLYEEQ